MYNEENIKRIIANSNLLDYHYAGVCRHSNWFFTEPHSYFNSSLFFQTKTTCSSPSWVWVRTTERLVLLILLQKSSHSTRLQTASLTWEWWADDHPQAQLSKNMKYPAVHWSRPLAQPLPTSLHININIQT